MIGLALIGLAAAGVGSHLLVVAGIMMLFQSGAGLVAGGAVLVGETIAMAVFERNRDPERTVLVTIARF